MLTANQTEAMRLLRAYTGGTFNTYLLAGQSKASCRAHIMSTLNGTKTPQSKAGMTILEKTFLDLAPIPSATEACIAVRERAFVEWAKTLGLPS